MRAEKFKEVVVIMKKFILAVALVCVLAAIAMAATAEKSTVDVQYLPLVDTLDVLTDYGTLEMVPDREWFEFRCQRACRPSDKLVAVDDWRRADHCEPGKTYRVIESVALVNQDGWRTLSVNALIGLCLSEEMPEINLTRDSVSVRMRLFGEKFFPGAAKVQSTYPAMKGETRMENGWLVPVDWQIDPTEPTGRQRARRVSGIEAEVGFVQVTMTGEAALDVDVRDFDLYRSLLAAYGGMLFSDESDWWIYLPETDVEDVSLLSLLAVDADTGHRVEKMRVDKRYFVIGAERFHEPLLSELPEIINTFAFYTRPTEFVGSERLASMGVYAAREAVVYDEKGQDTGEREYWYEDAGKKVGIEDDEARCNNNYRENRDGSYTFRFYCHTDYLRLPLGVLKVEGINMADSEGRKIFDWRYDPDGKNDFVIRAASGKEIGLLQIRAKVPETPKAKEIGEVLSRDADSNDELLEVSSAKASSDSSVSSDAPVTSAQAVSSEVAGSQGSLGCNGGIFAWGLVLLAPLGWLRKR